MNYQKKTRKIKLKKLLVIGLSIISFLLFTNCDNTKKVNPDETKATEKIESGSNIQEYSGQKITKIKEAKTDQQSIPNEWYGFQEGLELAKQENKHIVIDFYADWCKWCKVMDEKTFSVLKVKKYLFENFVPIRVNTELNDQVTFQGKTLSLRQLSSVFGVKGLPSLAFLTPEQEMITLIPGYIKKDKFMKILEYINKEYYKEQIPFEDFFTK
jgi:thioredoxin-related protein